MNAPANVAAAGEADSLTVLALQIAAGDLSGWPKTDWPIWGVADLQSAADELLHESNPFELDFMLARQECNDRFHAATLPDHYGLDDFIEDRAMWNGPDTIFARGRRP